LDVYGSDEGGRTAAVLTTLIATCKRLHIDPFAYLRDLFQRISDHPKIDSPNCFPINGRQGMRLPDLLTSCLARLAG